MIRKKQKRSASEKNVHRLALRDEYSPEEIQHPLEQMETVLSTSKAEEFNSVLAELDKKFLTPLFEKTIEYADAFRQAWSDFMEAASGRLPETGANMSTEEDVVNLSGRMTY